MTAAHKSRQIYYHHQHDQRSCGYQLLISCWTDTTPFCNLMQCHGDCLRFCGQWWDGQVQSPSRLSTKQLSGPMHICWYLNTYYYSFLKVVLLARWETRSLTVETGLERWPKCWRYTLLIATLILNYGWLHWLCSCQCWAEATRCSRSLARNFHQKFRLCFRLCPGTCPTYLRAVPGSVATGFLICASATEAKLLFPGVFLFTSGGLLQVVLRH